MGWGEFEITITVHFHADANEKPLVRGADASGATGASRLTQGGGGAIPPCERAVAQCQP